MRLGSGRRGLLRPPRGGFALESESQRSVCEFAVREAGKEHTIPSLRVQVRRTRRGPRPGSALPDGASPHQRSAPRATATKPAEDRFVAQGQASASPAGSPRARLPLGVLLAMTSWGFSPQSRTLVRGPTRNDEGLGLRPPLNLRRTIATGRRGLPLHFVQVVFHDAAVGAVAVAF